MSWNSQESCYIKNTQNSFFSIIYTEMLFGHFPWKCYHNESSRATQKSCFSYYKFFSKIAFFIQIYAKTPNFVQKQRFLHSCKDIDLHKNFLYKCFRSHQKKTFFYWTPCYAINFWQIYKNDFRFEFEKKSSVELKAIT